MDVDFVIQDDLGMMEDKVFKSQLQPGEKVLCSAYVSKYNYKTVSQQRMAVVTTHYIYNIAYEGLLVSLLRVVSSSSVIKRKIPIESVSAFTVSTYPPSDQFVIHVEKEHDYRYSPGAKKRESLIKAICYAFRLRLGRKIPFHFKEEADLGCYQTHEVDVKKIISKRPRDAAIHLSDQDLNVGLDAYIKGKKNVTKDDFYLERVSLKDEYGGMNSMGPTLMMGKAKSNNRDGNGTPESKSGQFSNGYTSFRDTQPSYYEETGTNYDSIPMTSSVVVKK